MIEANIAGNLVACRINNSGTPMRTTALGKTALVVPSFAWLGIRCADSVSEIKATNAAIEIPMIGIDQEPIVWEASGTVYSHVIYISAPKEPNAIEYALSEVLIKAASMGVKYVVIPMTFASALSATEIGAVMLNGIRDYAKGNERRLTVEFITNRTAGDQTSEKYSEQILHSFASAMITDVELQGTVNVGAKVISIKTDAAAAADGYYIIPKIANEPSLLESGNQAAVVKAHYHRQFAWIGGNHVFIDLMAANLFTVWDKEAYIGAVLLTIANSGRDIDAVIVLPRQAMFNALIDQLFAEPYLKQTVAVN
jgi:hypothetical protein